MTTEHPTTHTTARVKKSTATAAAGAKKRTTKPATGAKSAKKSATKAATAAETMKTAKTTTAATSSPSRPGLPKFDLPKLDMPKFDLPKFDLPKFDLPKLDMLKFDLPKLSELGSRVSVPDVPAWVGDARARAHSRAVSAKDTASHTVTLIREAVGV